MARNIEIKAALADYDAVAARAAALATSGPFQLTQDDSFFAIPTGRLKLRDMPDGAELIGYRRPDVSGPKLSEYWRSPVADAASMRELLTHSLGLIGRVRKQRCLYLAGRTRIHLDRVEGLGDFMELEVVLREGEALAAGEAEAQALMQQLQVPDAACVATAYVDLLAQRAPAPPAAGHE
jgi:predicted adenylyl cyclase CyaB